MNRKKKAKLAIKRETLRNLDEAMLARVAGGTILVYDINLLQAATMYTCDGMGRLGTSVSCDRCF